MRDQNVGPVSGGHNNDVGFIVKAIHLHQNLVQGLFTFIMTTTLARHHAATYRINFIDKHNGGSDCFGFSNRSRTRLAPTPTNISTNSEPEIWKKGTPASPATAVPVSVLPVPGGPTIRHTFGNTSTHLHKFSGSRRNCTTSANSILASSTPATSSKVTVGRSASLRFLALLRPNPKMLLPPPPCICRKPRLKIQMSSKTGPMVKRMLKQIISADDRVAHLSLHTWLLPGRIVG